MFVCLSQLGSGGQREKENETEVEAAGVTMLKYSIKVKCVFTFIIYSALFQKVSFLKTLTLLSQR